ncbi:MAG: hypothetical protein J0H99_00985, partial [Rhodospirillales bacterium]|nr:hypothetical protein [Rhodospirillales bacterium]
MHPLVLHNSLTRRKERFEPIDPQHVRMYVCGPTVYDLVHIGNARPVVVFDVLARLLRRLYPRVTYVRNVTDVDDKINARARALDIPIATLTFSVGLAVVALTPWFALGILGMAFAGVFWIWMFAATNTAVQLLSP